MYKHFDAETVMATQTIGGLLHHTNLLKDRILEKYLIPHDITTAQFKALLMLWRGAETPAELSRIMALDSGATTRMLDRLENKGLLARERSSDDRRQVRLSLTPAGRALTDHIPQVAADAMNEMVGQLTPDELTTLQALLSKILGANGCPLPPNLKEGRT